MVLAIAKRYEEFFADLVAVSVFASNILFWSESGYFETAAELKPLLHTWSLAVDERYYVLFLLFLILLRIPLKLDAQEGNDETI